MFSRWLGRSGGVARGGGTRGGGGGNGRGHEVTTTPTTLIKRRSISSQDTPAYRDTIHHLKIGSHTRVIVQGFTGRNATANSQESIAWGTNIVGGVVPNRRPGMPEEHLDRPLFPSVRAAMTALRPDATAVYVPAHQAPAAIEEALEAEVPLIVAVAEHIPVHAMLRIHSMLRTQRASRLVGPNSPGIINVAEGNRCRIGFQPLPVYAGGCVGLVAKSGTLSYEAAASTTRAGLGQSLCVGVGGDMLPGTDMDEALAAVLADENTQAVALMGELGGDAELRAAAELMKRQGDARRKPVAFLLAGYDAPTDRVMGHAGAFWQPGDPTIQEKQKALLDAGATQVHHPSQFGPVLASMLGRPPPQTGEPSITGTFTGGSSSSSSSHPLLQSNKILARKNQQHPGQQQIREFHLDTKSTMRLWETATDKDKADNYSSPDLCIAKAPMYLAFGIDRSTRDWCFWTCLSWTEDTPSQNYTKIPFSMLRALPEVNSITNNLLAREKEEGRSVHSPSAFYKAVHGSNPGLLPTYLMDQAGWANQAGLLTSSHERHMLGQIMWGMVRQVERYQAKLLILKFIPPRQSQSQVAHVLEESSSSSSNNNNNNNNNSLLPLEIIDMSLDLDDAAYRRNPQGATTSSSSTSSSSRSKFTGPENTTYDLYQDLQSTHFRDEGAAEAEAFGLVYHRLDPTDRTRTVGIVVNGAGLSMNTLDELARQGLPAANFLDTGGLATSQTVAKSIEVILRDRRVRVLLVNIFGGLTKGDMIARGILQALEIHVPEVPLVVRIQGTGEAEGRRILREEGGEKFPGKMFVYADFHEALRKVQQVVEDATAAKGEKETTE